jgi:hypothetical protein
VTCRTLTAKGRDWRFCPVDPPQEAGYLQVVARAQIVDDITLAAPQVPLEVDTDRAGFFGRSGPDGLIGAIGHPAQLLPPSQAPGTPFELTVEAAGHAPLTLAGALPAQPGYPMAFFPLEFGTRRLQRDAASIHGRVTRLLGGIDQPVAGATVTVTAAQPVPALAGALPAPPPAALFIGLGDVTAADGSYRLGPIARAFSLTITASEGGDSAVRTLALDYASPVNLLDFRLP